MSEKVSVACQTDPNLIDKLIDNHIRKQLNDVDLYQDYVRSAECAQFWPLDKNPIRSLVPSMLKVDLPEQHLKNESLMFDLVQAITNNSKLVNLLAKYIHHIVPNVIISKRIDLIPLITCTIRVCPDTNEQERLISLLFNLIKRPNEEQRRMILSGIIVVLQVSPHQNSSLLLPNLWDHVNDKFPERRILLAESCSTLAHYVRPIMRTNLILSILIQLLRDKNPAVRSATCKSFACLLSLIMDRNDEVFDACLSATEDIIQDMLVQTPVSFCEHRFELEQMRFCILETIFPLIAMWAVKLNRFKLDVAEFYLLKADRYCFNLLNNISNNSSSSSSSNSGNSSINVNGVLTSVTPPLSPVTDCPTQLQQSALNAAAYLQQQQQQQCQVSGANANGGATNINQALINATSRGSLAAAAVAKRRSAFFESRHSSSLSLSSCSMSSSATSGGANSSGISCMSSASSTNSSSFLGNGPASLLRRQSAFVSSSPTTTTTTTLTANLTGGDAAANNSSSAAAAAAALLTSQRAINAYFKILNYIVPFVFSDAVHSCAWLTKSKLHLPQAVDATNDDSIAGGSSSVGGTSNSGSEHKGPLDSFATNSTTSTGSTAAAASPISGITSNVSSTTAAAAAATATATATAATTTTTTSETQLKFGNKLLEPTLLVDESAIVAFHDQLEQEHMIDSVDWILNKFLVRFLNVLANFSHKKFYQMAAGNSADILHEYLFTIIASVRQLCQLFGKHLTRTKLRPLIKQYVLDNKMPSLFFVYIASLSSFEPIEQQEFEEIVLSVRQNLLMPELTRNDVEILAISIKIIATHGDQVRSPSTRQKFLTYILDALVNYSNQTIRTASMSSSGSTGANQTTQNGNSNRRPSAALNSLSSSSAVRDLLLSRSKNNNKNKNNNTGGTNHQQLPNQTQAKEFMLIIFRHILTCLIDPNVRPTEWAHILVTKFLPLLILLANDSTDVYVCTYARLMCAQLVDTFDNYLSCPRLTQQMASSIMPALNSLKGLTEQIRASNLKRQIECLTRNINEKFFSNQSDENNNNGNKTGNDSIAVTTSG